MPAGLAAIGPVIAGPTQKCTRRDSNPQPSVPKTDALSIELRVRYAARVTGHCRTRRLECIAASARLQ